MKNCKARAKKIIDEMHPEDVEALLPLLEHIDSVRETLDILSDPDALKQLQASREEFSKGKVTALEDL